MQRAVFMLICVQLVDAVGLGLLLPVLPYFVQEFGASAVEVTQLVAVYALAGMLFSPWLGRLSDRVGRKRLVLCCAVGSVAAYAGYLLAQSLAMIFVLRLFSGVMSAKSGVVTAWLIDLAADKDRARFLGLLGSMNGIGMLIGPVLASLLFVGSGEYYRSVFIGGALLSALAAVAVCFIDPGVKPSQHPSKQRVGQDGPYRDLLWLNFAVFLAFSVIFSTSAIYMQSRFQWDVGAAGLAIGLMTGTVAFARAVVAHRLLAKLGVETGTCVAASVMALGLMLCSLFDAAHIFLPLYCLAAGAYAVAALGVTLLLANRVSPEARGLGMGRLGAASSAAIVIGAATHGYVFEALGPAAPFQIYGLLVAVFIMGWYRMVLEPRSRKHGKT